MKQSTLKQRLATYGALLLAIVGIIAAAKWGPALSPDMREPTCLSNEAPYFHNGWVCVPARKP